jgi:hypothetical protein
MRVIISTLLLFSAAFAGDDPKEIVRKSVNLDSRNWDLSRNYTYRERTVMKLQSNAPEVKTFDVMILYGEQYRRLIQKDDKPLSSEAEKKEREKLEKLTTQREKETPAQRDKRLAEQRKNRERQRAFAREIPEAFDFRLLGSENAAGRDCWVIEAQPRPGFKPKDRQAKLLSHFRGKLWIDKEEFQWVKGEAEAIDNISFGLVLARLNKGARLEFEQSRINDEVWLPKQIRAWVEVRLGLVKKMSAEADIAYSGYRKFQADSRIVSTAEPAPE